MKPLIPLLFLAVTSCSSPVISGPIFDKQEDYYILLSELLDTNRDRNTYVDSEGKPRINELQSFKELENIYIEYTRPQKTETRMSAEQIRVLMFIAFYAQNRNSAALNEYLAEDLMPIYQSNKGTVVSAMGDLPFLIAPTCNRLNAYFEFKGFPSSRKTEFVQTEIKSATVNLTDNQAAKCAKEFKE